ncbi:MAG: hypothetical protein ACK5XN_07835, partial [Bacteroidota bacterium]
EEEAKEEVKKYVIDIPVQQWGDYQKTKIYITEKGLVHNQFYKFLCEGDVYNGKKLKMSEKEGITQFQCGTNTIISNPDVHEVIKTIEKLNKRENVATKYEFNGQKIDTLAREVLDKEFGGVPQSMMNQQLDEIFHSEFIRNCQFNGWFSQPELYSKNNLEMQKQFCDDIQKIKNQCSKECGKDCKKNCEKQADEIFAKLNKLKQQKNVLSAYDYNKHYTSVLRGDDAVFGTPVYNIFDEIKPFKPKHYLGDYNVDYHGIQCGRYYVETTHGFPLRGNAWYDADLVRHALEMKYISKNDVKLQIIPSNTMSRKHFKHFIETVYAHFETPKDAINRLIGCFGHDYKNRNEHNFTTDPELAFNEIVQNEDAKIKYVYFEEFDNTFEQNSINEPQKSTPIYFSIQGPNTKFFTTCPNIAMTQLKQNMTVTFGYGPINEKNSENEIMLDVNRLYKIMNNRNHNIDIDAADINDFVTSKKPLCYHLFDNSRHKTFQNSLP